jgi:putative ABC transport system permease protein
MGETILLTLIALMTALILLLLMLPSFNSLSGKALSLNQAGSMSMVLGLIIVALFTGFFAGSYPALFLSAFKPATILHKDSSLSSRGGSKLRRILVIVQFAFTIGLIITCSVIYRQMHFIKHKDLGFNQDHVIVFSNPHLNLDVLREKLKSNPDILHVSSCQAPRQTLHGSVDFQWPGKDPRNDIMLYPIPVDYHYLDTFKIKMAKGRFFNKEFATDAEKAVIINESAARIMGMDKPLGKQVTFRGKSKVIIGVVKDFHMSSLHNPIEPLVFNYHKMFFQICVRIKPQHVKNTIDHIKTTWSSLTNRPFEYEFLNDKIDNFYKKEQKTASLVLYSTILAVVIALLGLIGLASHTAEQRTKEIGIRKVLGASITEVIMLLIKDITRWFLVSNLVAWPFAYFVASKWMQNFAYHSGISLWVFFLSAASALTIAALTIITQVYKAARQNPVKALRYE